ncbi:MAG: sodium:proton antiporter [Ignavibacteriaceae bacterium]
MSEQILIGLTSILVFGMLAQWISWRFALPSILLLLIFGVVAGPITGLLNPDDSFGKVLFPLVSASVAIILFEGGANLKFSELKQVGGVVVKLVSIGIAVTWALSTAAAYFILGFDINLALLFGAILVVTGPTVILPILRHVRPMGQINPVLKWEGIINDPIGALLAILVFEAILAGGFEEATFQVVSGLLKAVLISSTVGVAGAYTMVLLLKQKLLPEFLQNSVSIAMVILAFTISNIVQAESGLFAVTIMGIALANQKKVNVKQLIEFKETLRALLLSFLFMVLAARIDLSSFSQLGWGSLVFVVILIFLIRPVAVVLSSLNSTLNWKEKLYLSFMAPRGVVAAAVASIFAIELTDAGYPEAGILVPAMFLVIVSTIAVYGLSSMPLARWLKIASPNPQGCLILGAHSFSRAIGKVLQSKGITVLLVDTNKDNIMAAKMENIPAYYGSILGEGILDELDLTGIGKLLALTPNKEVNSLAVMYFSKIFGSSEVYQINAEKTVDTGKQEVSSELTGQILFNSNITYNYINEKYSDEALIKTTEITSKFTYDIFLYQHKNETIIPLFLIPENKKLIVYTNENQPKPKPGQQIISFIEQQNVEIVNN